MVKVSFLIGTKTTEQSGFLICKIRDSDSSFLKLLIRFKKFIFIRFETHPWNRISAIRCLPVLTTRLFKLQSFFSPLEHRSKS